MYACTRRVYVGRVRVCAIRSVATGLNQLELRNASHGLGMLNHEWSKHTRFGKRVNKRCNFAMGEEPEYFAKF